MPRTGVNNTMCCVPGCHSKKKQSISFHIFPQQNKSWVRLKNIFGVEEKVDRYKAWLIKLKIGARLSRRAVVCSLHFTKEDYILPDCPTQRRRLKLTAVPSLNLPKTSHKAPAVKSDLHHNKENIPVETEAPVKDILHEFRVDEIDPSSCSSGPSQEILQLRNGNLPKTLYMPTVRKQKNSTLSREGSSDPNMEVCEVSSDRVDCLATENCTRFYTSLHPMVF